MDENTGADQAEDAVVDNGAEQSQDLAPAESNQANQEVKLSEFAVGKNDYKDLAGLKKAHEELQKGFTQKSQEWSRKEKAYKYMADFIAPFRADQKKWDRLMNVIENGLPEDRTQAVQQIQQDPELVKRLQNHEERIMRYEAEAEFMKFRDAHPDLDDEMVGLVVNQLGEWEKEGKERSLEEALRWIYPEKIAPSIAKKAEERARLDALKKSKSASMGGQAPQAQSPKGSKGKPATENEMNQRILKLFKEAGAKFEED